MNLIISGKGNYEGTLEKTFKITPLTLTVTTESAEKVYDGTPLTAGGTMEGLLDGETASLKITGSQTEVGKSRNTCQILWDGAAEKSNYTVKKTTGTLKVTAPETSYSCVRGADDTWKKGSGKTLTFIYKRSWKDEETIDHFTGILVDGKDVDKSCYTAVSGSVKITLNASYLETLSAGKHTFEALFDDAATEAVTFNILDNGSSNGKTGDENTPGIWIGIFLAAGAIFAGLLVIRLKKRKKS